MSQTQIKTKNKNQAQAKTKAKTQSKASRFLWKTARSCFKRAGVEVLPYRKGYHYVPDYYGRKAKTRVDIKALPGFGELARRVIQQGRTLHYYDKFYIIYQSLMNLKRLPSARTGDSSNAENRDGFNSAEAGVYRGGTSYFIAAAGAALGLPLTHYCFDTFEGHAEEDISIEADDYKAHQPQTFSDTDYAMVKEYLKEFQNVRVHKGRFQDSCPVIANEKFHFVHLDMDLYDPTVFALDFFDERLVPGGIIIVDDYQVHTCPGVIQAIDEFLKKKPNYFAWHPLTEQCVLVKQLLAISD